MNGSAGSPGVLNESGLISGPIVGLILAAGYSSRMSALKALYPVGDELVIERAIRILAEGGVSRVHVVVGHKAELIRRAVKRFEQISSEGADAGNEAAGLRGFPEIIIVDNPDYDLGMFSSVLAGVRSLPPDASGFLLYPVDYPFVKSETVAALVRRADRTNPADQAAPADPADQANPADLVCRADIISPVCGGKAGHPPVISRRVFNSILEAGSSAPGPEFRGLQTVLSSPQLKTLQLETFDSGILDDIDDDEAYRRLLEKYEGIELSYPGAAERTRMLEAMNPGGNVIAHMEKTAEIALDFAERLNACGLRLNPGLLASAALLHDICKGRPNHAAAAADYLISAGYPAVGAVAAQHMNIIRSANNPIDEAAVLYLADKMTEGDRIVPLPQRLESKLEQFSDNPEAQTNIRRRFDDAFIIKEQIEGIISNG